MDDKSEILLVEDNPDDIKLAMHAFEKHRLANHVTVLRDGAEALDFLFRRGPYSDLKGKPLPKLVLLDLKLPLVSGIEVLREIKNDPTTQMIPVVALTSSQEDLDLENCYRLGVNSYILKPVDFEQFLDVVRQLGFYWLLLNRLPGSRG